MSSDMFEQRVKLRFTFKCTVQGARGLTTLFPYYRWGSNLQDYRITRDGTFLFPKSVQATSFVGALSGNASTATKLQTPRTIWGQSFDGSANVSGNLDLGSSDLT